MLERNMFHLSAFSVPVALLALALCPGNRLVAADAGKDGPVYLDAAQADEDYRLQGEYRGYQAPLGNVRSREAIGLQVVAQGNGEFVAVKYYGGLPGAGWQQEGRYELTGKRNGAKLELIGEEYDILVDGETALVFTHSGRQVGQLRKVDRVSPTMGAAPPPGAIVLFDGTSTDHFVNGKINEHGLLMAGCDTKDAFQDFRLHGEFRLPYKPQARGQNRGNSGFYLQGRYEVQVLDSFGLEGIENECGALYRTRRPDINMCLPPLQWQTYDIDFKAARFDDAGNKIENMRISVWHNGVLVHDAVELSNKTGAGKPETADPLPTKLQDHGNPVVYRNLWIVDTTQRPAAAPSLPIPVSAPPTPLAIRPPYPYSATIGGPIAGPLPVHWQGN